MKRDDFSSVTEETNGRPTFTFISNLSSRLVKALWTASFLHLRFSYGVERWKMHPSVWQHCPPHGKQRPDNLRWVIGFNRRLFFNHSHTFSGPVDQVKNCSQMLNLWAPEGYKHNGVSIKPQEKKHNCSFYGQFSTYCQHTFIQHRITAMRNYCTRWYSRFVFIYMMSSILSQWSLGFCMIVIVQMYIHKAPL